MKRYKKHEEPKRGLIRWYEDRKKGTIASFFDKPNDMTMRVSTKKGCEEIGFPFSDLKSQKEDWFKKTAEKWAKRIDEK